MENGSKIQRAESSYRYNCLYRYLDEFQNGESKVKGEGCEGEGCEGEGCEGEGCEWDFTCLKKKMGAGAKTFESAVAK
jgi:hypothetical protein